MNLTGYLALALACMFCGPPVHAHGDWKPKHGGVLNEGGETTFELVQSGAEIVAYVEDHGEAVDTKGAVARLVLEKDSRKIEVPMQPDGANRLKARNVVLRQWNKATLRVQFRNGSVAVGRFRRSL